VLEAAGTKWNFLRFYPGLVGGHCIGVDPYYLTFKAKELKYHPQVIDSGRFVNDSMGPYIAKQLVKKLISAGKNVMNCRILIMGTTFKENVSDIRNSKVADVYNELISYGVHIDVVDPHANSEEVRHEYGYPVAAMPSGKYDAVIVAVSHKDYINLKEEDFESLMNDNGILVDVKGLYRKIIKKLTYWSL
jgi:UDP-N-acetyl-D-galactosamine dehydrogenase